MLKKIAVSQLRLGMHLHKLQGSWLAHSFWRTRFVIDDPVELKRLHESGVAECWIDVDRGGDVAAAAAPPPVAPVVTAATTAVAAAGDVQRSFNDELRHAAGLCQRGREAVVAVFNEARMGRSIDVEGCLPLVDEIAVSVQRNPGALVSLARLKSRDDYSYMHSVAVCALMVALARQQGMTEDACREAGLAGLMHDIGKALMPLQVLNKPGRLTDDEYRVMQSHPQRGHDLLIQGDGVAATLDVILHHHEKVDGSGYPHRLKGEQISLLARMGAICDVYDAITSNRPYKAGWDPAESIARMAGWKGHFDERLFAAFVHNLGIYPTGSRVRLESGRLAVVMEQNRQNLTAPIVKVFYSAKSKMRIAPQQLDLAAKTCHDRILGRDGGEHGSFAHLDELWADADLLRRMKVA